MSELEWHHNVFFQLFGEMIVGESQRKTYSETMKREERRYREHYSAYKGNNSQAVCADPSRET